MDMYRRGWMGQAYSSNRWWSAEQKGTGKWFPETKRTEEQEQVVSLTTITASILISPARWQSC